MSAADQPNGYRRSLGPWDAALVVVGGIIGGGIFLNPGIAAQRTESGLALLLAWIGAGVLTLVGALCYAELGARRPQAGGTYVYLREAFGPLAGFLFGWTMLLVIYSGSTAAVATIFASYTVAAFALPASAALPLTAGALVFVALVNLFGLKLGAQVQNLFALLKLLAVAVLVACGLYLAGAHAPAALAADPAHAGAGFMGAALPVLFAYSGFTYLNNLAGEVHAPQHNLPRALLVGMLLVIGAYALVNLAYLAVLGHAGLAASTAPAAQVMDRMFGPAGARLMAVGIAISTLGFCNITLLAGARVLQVMGADGLFFGAVARLHPRHRTPNVALAALAGWAIVLALSGSYGALLDYATFGDWLACAVGVATLFWYRRHDRGGAAFRVPGYPLLPLLFVGAIGAVVVATMRDNPRHAGVGVLIMLAGVPVYFAWRRLGSRGGR
ncbi:APC family permease [Frateuria terrea]|uniref:Basic amino acid/polyamine antiporter, APA family n=1 Tax=Frateuria terrea TaxID=529704 RepID=A0A1H6YL96_9GAMM|nr:amino acid permease [Frateuria terrea]SEJ41176.1 basic amino acid/polyamine antiporter, APA family [Frateuria terrea]SFP74491.1 basic amino acid/polyamine antiporter, APA family [Frateuria terrea]